MTNNDMLIKLYDMEFDTAYIKQQTQQDVIIRKPIGPDRGSRPCA
jgi:hypothetical protein